MSFIVTHWWIWMLVFMNFAYLMTVTKDTKLNKVLCFIPGLLISWAGELDAIIWLLFMIGSGALLLIAVIGAIIGIH